MAVKPAPSRGHDVESHQSWLPMIVIALAQITMSFNVSALPILIGGIVRDLDTEATTIATALVVYSLFVAGFIMLGAKLGKFIGSRLILQVGMACFGLAMVMMVFSRSATMLISAQGVAGLAAAVAVPTLVVMIATHYEGRQQAQAVGFLLAAHALGGVLALAVAGYLGTVANWRYPFGILAALAVVVLLLSPILKRVARERGVRIDWFGVALSACAIALISLGCNAINEWGLLLAKSSAPFSVLGLSPAVPMIVIGVVMLQAFLLWTNSRRASGKSPLIALQVLDAAFQRYAVLSLFTIVALDAAVNFLIPLYIQIVQGRTSLETSVAVVPYSIAIFIGAIFVVRLYDWLPPRAIARFSFLAVAAGLAALAFVIHNQWSTVTVILGLLVVGLAQGALLTLLFNVLLTASPKELAGDVGSLRGVTNNLGVGVGTAIAGALVVGLLSASIMTELVDNPTIPAALKSEVNFDNANFISNGRLISMMNRTSATPAQIDEAVRINEEARLDSLRRCFFILAGLALLTVIPAGGLPGPAASNSAPDDASEPLKRRRSASDPVP